MSDKKEFDLIEIQDIVSDVFGDNVSTSSIGFIVGRVLEAQSDNDVIDRCIDAVNKQYEMYQKEDWTGTPRYSCGIVNALRAMKDE